MFARLKNTLSFMQTKQHWFLLLSAFAGFLLLVMLYFSITELSSDIKLSHKVVQPTAIKTQTDDSVQNLIAALPQAHLFGQKPLATSYIPITSLNIRLTGILKAPAGSLSKAIIANADKPGEVYRVGDTLPGGIGVYAIDETGIVLENAGHLEKLPLIRPVLSFLPPPAKAS